MDDHLNWRYATKKFDPSKIISPEDIAALIEAVRLSPSSYGLQPWKVILVKDPALRRAIRTHAWDQAQITDASHLMVLCSLRNIDKDYIHTYIAQIAKDRGVSVESLAGFERMMLGVLGQSPEEISNWMKRQVYLALGMLLSTCAQRKIDSCPIEGFQSTGVDDVLGLAAQGIESVVLCPVGYRAPDDHHASLKKVRFGKEDIVIER
jgi:nitroreductase